MCHSLNDGDKFNKILKNILIQCDTQIKSEAIEGVGRYVEMKVHRGAKFLTEIVLKLNCAYLYSI